MVTRFRDLPWTERRQFLGDEAEERYEEDRRNRGVRFTEYGLRRPPFNGEEMAQLPDSIRYDPDYIESWGRRLRFVEVQGVGDDGIVRLKDDKFAALVAADAKLPCWLWLWFPRGRRFVCVPLAHVGPLVLEARRRGQRDVFDRDRRNPKPYTWLLWDTLTANASQHRIAPSRRAAAMGTRLAGRAP
jgi:hypothetical protein